MAKAKWYGLVLEPDLVQGSITDDEVPPALFIVEGASAIEAARAVHGKLHGRGGPDEGDYEPYDILLWPLGHNHRIGVTPPSGAIFRPKK